VVGRLAVAGDRKKRTLNLEICMTKKQFILRNV